ncbi:hypothetical protein OOK31_36455 [Streptomyces sp. NBC_00249]|uniref:hypothetical protein n=1 Tax=Streptomyces sp. NBC_00249 TaxID=2975690 RepID=UPI00224DA30F|nr:hypothetical protein [Streptomyces sp. NBC_00249]MCX5199307.1 hypothetical protein [Streptomyces sp. NBC_00249]
MTVLTRAAATALALLCVLPVQAASAAGPAVPAAAAAAAASSTPGTWAAAIHVKETQVVTIGWDYGGNPVGKYDWVGLYSCDPQECGVNRYVSGAWQWASSGTSYTFTRALSDSLIGTYWTGYVSYDYASGQYRLLSSHMNLLA